MKTSWIAIIILVGIIACPASAKLIVPNSTELTVSSEYAAKINAVNYNNGTSSRWICAQDQCWFNWSNPYSRNITGIYFIDSDTVHTIYGVDATRPNLSQPLFPTTSFAPVNNWKWINFSNNYTTSAISIKFTSSPTWSTFAEIQYYEDEPPAMNTTVRLYLPMNGTTGTTTLPDISSFQEALTRYGDAQIYSEASNWKFYNATYFDGTGDMLRYPPEAINFGTSYPWSIGFWMKSNSSTSWNSIVGNIDRTTRSPGELRIGSRTNAGNVFYIDGWWAGADVLASNSSENLNDGNPHYVLVKRVNATAIEGWVDGHRSVTDIVNSAMPAGDPVRNLTIGLNGVDNIYYKGYIDDLFITYGNISGSTVPTTEFLSWEMGTPGTAPVASFTAVPNPSFIGYEAQFTDASTNTPTTWGWTFGDSNYTDNTTQNPKHLFASVGTYSVCLNASNSYGSNKSCSNQVVTNVSAFHPQDVWMEGLYNRTVHVTTTGGAPLSNVTVTSSDGQAATTNPTGYAFITEGFGVYVFHFTKDGYDPKSLSVIVDEDGTNEIQMTEASNVIKNQNTWYSPHQVRLEVWNSYGNKMPGIIVNATANQSSMPDNWYTDLYGIEPGVANDMLNRTLIMQATTGSDGAVVYTLHGAISYDIRMTNPQTGAMFLQMIMPKNDEYALRLETASALPNQTANVYNRLANTSLTFSEPNNSYITMGLQYQDTLGATSSLKFFVFFTENRTTVYTVDLGNPGTSVALANYTTRNIWGTRYTWNYTAVRS